MSVEWNQRVYVVTRTVWFQKITDIRIIDNNSIIDIRMGSDATETLRGGPLSRCPVQGGKAKFLRSVVEKKDLQRY